MAVQPQFLAYILEQLDSIGSLRSKRMFGGVGLYSGELFFGLIDDDTVFFKADASNSADYTARDMPRFMPFPDRPEAVMAYYQVPADIIEDAESLVSWARKSVAVALASHAARNARKARPKSAATKRRARAKPAKKTAAPRAKPVKKGKARRAQRRTR
jgi:DNA transformation protein